MLYVPFDQLNEDLFRTIVDNGYRYFVLQRFEWPGVADKVGFLLSPYQDAQQAMVHAHHLGEKEGKALELPRDADRISALLETGSGYRIFLNRIKETDWSKRMLRMYKDSIINYLRNKTRFKRSDSIEILFTLEHGRVWAVISNGNTEKRVKAVDLIE